jgi:aminocarboxymuconate-semialdehyde decarboxylase
LLGIKPEQLVFATDYPQDFTGVSTDTGRGMTALREYIAAVKNLDLDEKVKNGILGETAAKLLGLE